MTDTARDDLLPGEPDPGPERPRRLRRTPRIRDLVRETLLSPSRLVMPHFVIPADRGRQPIESMPEIDRLGTDDLVTTVGQDLELGISSVLLFGNPKPGTKDERGGAAGTGDDSTTAAVEALKRRFGDDLVVFTDVCLCAYTSHGHCGILRDGYVENDPTLARLAEVSVGYAEAGADFVAPSDMMDGRVGAIRDALDARGLGNAGILSYAVKYASGYYGPFRDAADSAPGSGDRKSHQMDPGNVREAVREVELDEAEGADMVMVKPALAYLDVIRAVRETTTLPVAAYNVSGEYSMVKAAAERGWADEATVVRENLLAIARAGADVIITYHGRRALREGWL